MRRWGECTSQNVIYAVFCHIFPSQHGLAIGRRFISLFPVIFFLLFNLFILGVSYIRETTWPLILCVLFISLNITISRCIYFFTLFLSFLSPSFIFFPFCFSRLGLLKALNIVHVKCNVTITNFRKKLASPTTMLCDLQTTKREIKLKVKFIRESIVMDF